MEDKELKTLEEELEQADVDISKLFEPDSSELIDMSNIPAPEGMEEEVSNRPDINSIKSVDDVLEMIMEANPDDPEHSNCLILAAIQKLHGIEEGMNIDDIPEEDREYVDDIEVSDCKVDIYSMDGRMTTLLLTFDSVHSAYLKELNELINRYRVMQEDLAMKSSDTAAMFSIILMPRRMEGLASCTMNFPLMYARVLSDNDVNCSFQMMFDINDINFAVLDIDEETDAEITANAMRSAEEGTGGNLFEE